MSFPLEAVILTKREFFPPRTGLLSSNTTPVIPVIPYTDLYTAFPSLRYETLIMRAANRLKERINRRNDPLLNKDPSNGARAMPTAAAAAALYSIISGRIDTEARYTAAIEGKRRILSRILNDRFTLKPLRTLEIVQCLPGSLFH